MKFLLIEDDNSKAEDVIAYIKSEINGVVIDVAKSYHSGLKCACKIDYDLMIVDMTLPKYDGDACGDESSLYNGGEVLISYVLDLGKRIKSIVFTQYETFMGETLGDINNRLIADCSETYVGCVKYDSTSESWKQKLLDKINYAIDINNR